METKVAVENIEGSLCVVEGFLDGVACPLRTLAPTVSLLQTFACRLFVQRLTNVLVAAHEGSFSAEWCVCGGLRCYLMYMASTSILEATHKRGIER